MKSADILRGWLLSPVQKSPYIFGCVHRIHVTLTHCSSMKSSERAANSPNFPWIRSWHFNERKDNVWNKASPGFLPSMCHHNSTSCPSTQHFILFRPPESPLNTFSDSWGLSCQCVFPASGTQWLQTGPRKFLCVFVLFCFYFYEWLSRRTLTQAQYYTAIHKKQRENIVLCPVGNRLWYWPRLAGIPVIRDLCYLSAACQELPDSVCSLPARLPAEHSACSAFSLKWKKHSSEGRRAGLSPSPGLVARTAARGSRACSCQAQGGGSDGCSVAHGALLIPWMSLGHRATGYGHWVPQRTLPQRLGPSLPH